MADPYLSEIRIVSFNFAPKFWAKCDGQLLQINQNQALFSLLGTTFGGNGQTNFALPDLRSRVPINFGSGFSMGQQGGQENNTLILSQLPAHNHFVNTKAPADGSANTNNPSGAFFSNSAPAEIYNSGAGNPQQSAMAPASISNIGGSQPHNNMQPFLTLNFCIALSGIFPSQN